jgi:hypothetical protein
MATIIINIRHKTFTIDENEMISLARKKGHRFRYRFVPVVVYNKKTSGKDDLTQPFPESFNGYKPFSLYQLGTSIAILIKFMGKKKKIKKDDFTSAGKAFRELKNFTAQCYERTIADLCCKTILEEIQNRKKDEEIVFFLEKSASDKMLGRLATLNLNLDKVTICFLITSPSDLMTTVMSNQTGKLHFDIIRLMTTDIDEPLGPYPGDYEDSLVQSYFYRPLSLGNDKGSYTPMRLDIFAQGLLIKEIERKKDMIRKLLDPSSSDIETDSSSLEPRTLLPYGFKELNGFFDREEGEIERIIMGVED